ncbi:MAG: 1-acyl-sn-glycerol-3-phosphate acyltransferase [Lachnospiraceae bacterium]|nr:1-acyl-sn-glycerol-3-phosphate acyltransferase [Lachnospiraceae bacterium]
MPALRLFAILLWILIVFVLLGLPCLLVLLLVGIFSPALKDRLTQRFVVLVCGGITFLAGVKIQASGLENIPADRSALFISNHRSFFDIFCAYRFFRTNTGCVAKIEWRKLPVLNWWMMNLHCIFLDRKNTREGLKCIIKAAEELRNGRSIWICPEGTRSHTEELLPFHEGSFRAAFQSGAPIVPLTFTHTDDIFEKHLPWIKSGTIRLHFDKPIEVQELSRTEQKNLIRDVHAQIQARYREML